MGSAAVVVAVGTRPEAIKLAPVIMAMRAHGAIAPAVVTTGQHRQLVHDALDLFGIASDVDLAMGEQVSDLSTKAAQLIERAGQLLRERAPRAVVVQGDTLSAFGFGLAAFYERIPVVHVEAGLRSGDLSAPFPEEFHRRSTALLARLHFAPTERAAARLRGEHVPEGRIHVTGNTVVDALRLVRAGGARPAGSAAESPAEIPEVDHVLRGRTQLVLVTAHRRESWGAPLERVVGALEQLAADRPDTAFVVCVHPNPLVGSEFARLAGLDNVVLTPPVGYAEFVRLMDRADLILTDSGGIQEEAPSLGTPVLVLRELTERMENLDAGVARLIGTSTPRIVAEVQRLLDDPAALALMARVGDLHGDGHAAERCVKILADELDLMA
jgi:UDP-N-acetylglucosamine 2-epimerase (non-hydrolysing)